MNKTCYVYPHQKIHPTYCGWVTYRYLLSQNYMENLLPPILKVVQREHHRELWMGNMTCGHELSPHEHHRAS